ncbi:MAG: FtsX-like permease family protein [Planctomycetota bacterium]
MTQALRCIVRLEVRNLRREWGRSLLICLLIGLPMAAMVAGGTLVRLSDPSDQERARAVLGNADFKIIAADLNEVRRTLPANVKMEPISFGRETVYCNGMRLSVESRRHSVKGLAEGLIKVIAGRVPQTPREIAVSSLLQEVFGTSVGSTVEVEDSGTFQIVGVFEVIEDLDAVSVLYSFAPQGFWGRTQQLVQWPTSMSEAERGEFRTQLSSVSIVDRRSLTSSASPLRWLVFVLGGVALAEAALIVSAAFIVSLRRRRREIGLFASSGATRFHTLCAVIVNSVLLSMLAGISAVAVGLVVAKCLHPFLDSWNHRRNGPFEIDAALCLQSAVFGMFTAVAAALLPAWASARLPIREALASRSPAQQCSRRWGLIGSILVVIGAVFVASAPMLVEPDRGADGDNLSVLATMLGSILGLVGFGSASPWILERLAPLANHLPIGHKLAIREASRFRTRNGPIVTAILAGMSASVLIACIFQSVRSLDESLNTVFEPNHLIVCGSGAEAAVSQMLQDGDAVAAARIRLASVGEEALQAKSDSLRTRPRTIAVATPELLKLLEVTGETQNQTLEQSMLIALFQETPEQVVVEMPSLAEPLATLAAVATDTPISLRNVDYLISEDALEELQWQSTLGVLEDSRETWLVKCDQVVDRSFADRATSTASRYPGTTVDTQLNYGADRRQIAAVFALSFLTGLVVAAIATSLAQQEAIADERILRLVGASPGVARKQCATRASFLLAVGCALAIPSGVLPAYGILSMVPALEFHVPWPEMAMTLIGLPLCTYAIAWCSDWFWHRTISR